jgi:hypothetical protein
MALDEAHRSGWNDAAWLYRRLLNGDPLPIPEYSSLVLGQDETLHMDAPVEYARFYGIDVTYRQRSVVAVGSPVFVLGALAANGIGNAAARSSARRMAAPQWREFQVARAVLTDQRLLAHTRSGWLSFWHSGMAEYRPDPRGFALVLTYPDCEPVLLRGPAVPWVCVALAWLLYGPETLGRLPVFHDWLPPVPPAPGSGQIGGTPGP